VSFDEEKVEEGLSKLTRQPARADRSAPRQSEETAREIKGGKFLNLLIKDMCMQSSNTC
jgi:hypothetical protein